MIVMTVVASHQHTGLRQNVASHSTEKGIIDQRDVSNLTKKLEQCGFHDVADVMFSGHRFDRQQQLICLNYLRGKLQKQHENTTKPMRRLGSNCPLKRIKQKKSKRRIKHGKQKFGQLLYCPPSTQQIWVTEVYDAAASFAYIRKVLTNDDAERKPFLRLFDEEDFIEKAVDELMNPSDEDKANDETKSVKKGEAKSTLKELSNETQDAVTKEKEENEEDKVDGIILEQVIQPREESNKETKITLSVVPGETEENDVGTEKDSKASSAEDKEKNRTSSVETVVPRKTCKEISRGTVDAVPMEEEEDGEEDKFDGIVKQDKYPNEESTKDTKNSSSVVPQRTKNDIETEQDTNTLSAEDKAKDETKSVKKGEADNTLEELSKETEDITLSVFPDEAKQNGVGAGKESKASSEDAVPMEEEDDEGEDKFDGIVEQTEYLSEGSTKETKNSSAVAPEKTTPNDIETEKDTNNSSVPTQQGYGKQSVNGNDHPHHQAFMSRPTNVDEKTWKKGPCWNSLAVLCIVLSVANIGLLTVSASVGTNCPENQTAELGKESFIHCNFPENFHAVYWFNDPTPDSLPLIAYLRYSDEKSGPGFVDETFDVSENGSLLISEVGPEDEGSYQVLIYTDPDTFERHNVTLKVIAYPDYGSPRIQCDDCQQHYYHFVEENKTLTCSFNISRPPVQLEWIEQSPNGNSVLKNQITNFADNKDGTYNSSATVRLSRYGNKLVAVLLCRATWYSQRWGEETQMLLDFSHAESFSSLESNILYGEVNRKTEVRCKKSCQASKIWKKISFPHEPEIIGFSTGDVTEITTNLPDTEISVEGSLVFSRLQIFHEGLYACLCDDGKQDKIIMTDVKVLVPPSPPYIQVMGCKDNGVERCECKEEETDQLTCALYGVRPNASLEWIANDRNQISFSKSEPNIRERSQTFDVTESTKYKVSEDVLCEEDILIECRIYGPVGNIIKPAAQVRIIPKSCKTKKDTWIFQIISPIMTVIIIVPFIILCFGCFYCRCPRHQERYKPANETEITDVSDSDGMFPTKIQTQLALKVT